MCEFERKCFSQECLFVLLYVKSKNQLRVEIIEKFDGKIAR